jgi:predicted phage-related endonuclease
MERIDYPWMIASLDGWNKDDYPQVMEIKCGGRKLYDIDSQKSVPEYYNCQMQWQMWITGSTDVRYLVWYEGEFKCLIVFRDDSFIEKMVACVKEFYNRLLNFDPPPAVDKDYLAIDDAESLMLASDYKKTCDEIEALEKLKEMQRLQLIERSGNKNAKIGPLKVTRIVSSGRTDYKGAAIASGVDLAPFKGKPSESWRIS